MDRLIELDSDDSRKHQTVLIHQDTTVGVGGTIWDASLVLTYYLIKQYYNKSINALSHQSICNLSAGTGLEGIAIASMQYVNNCTVVITDIERHVDLIQHNIALNKAHINPTNTVTACEYFWGQPTIQLTHSGTFDIVLIADILYRPELYDQLLSTLQCLCHCDTVIYMCNEIREQVQHPLYMDKFYSHMKEIFVMQRVNNTELHDDYQCDTIELYKCRLRQR